MRLLVLALLASLGAAAAPAALPFTEETAARVIGGAQTDPVMFARLQALTDVVGPRLTGSPGAARAVWWALRELKADGLEARLEAVQVPHWVRGVERGVALAQSGGIEHPLHLTALGFSAGTPDGGLTAEIIEARSLEEVAALGEKAKGRIVLFQHEMKISADYGMASTLRTRGASAAAKVGAAGMLVRSAATSSMTSPHTGVTVFDDGQAAIPAAALATEDAELLHRLLARGPVKVRLELGCKTLPEVESHNVIADLPGRDLPDEVVLLGAHLDSWDLATGAIDDGAGVVMAMQALRTLSQLPRHPRRTVRVVLYMNEENGSRGARGYAKAHAGELAKHRAALEADSGAGRPLHLEVPPGKSGPELLAPWMAPLRALGVTSMQAEAHGGADIGILAQQGGVPMVGVRQDSSRYFDWHHSAADTLDKVDPRELAESAAAIAWLAYALAESEGVIDRATPDAAAH